jgi:5-methylcytosine-specific restriction endonuclease McrA
MYDIISKENAKEAGLSHYFTGVPCKRGHISLRFVSSRSCTQCQRLAEISRIRADPEKERARQRVWGAKSADRARKWRKANPERARETGRAWSEANPEKYRAIVRRKNTNRRLAVRAQLGVISPLELREISIIYEEAALLGPDWHVDHITPLSQGGDHRPYNMQIVRDRYNKIKNAKLWYTPADLGKHLPAHYAEAAM